MSTHKGKVFPIPRARQRYRYIKYLCDMRGQTVRDLHRLFQAANTARPCHYSVFYRICQGVRSSVRVQRWIARELRVPVTELWA